MVCQYHLISDICSASLSQGNIGTPLRVRKGVPKMLTDTGGIPLREHAFWSMGELKLSA